MALVFTWAPTRTIDLTRLPYNSFLLVPKGFTAEAHRKYWDYPFRDEAGRVSALLLSRIAKRLAQEGTTDSNGLVHRKLEVLVKKANEEARKLNGGNPAAEWILKIVPSGNVYMNKRTREERSEVPAEHRRLDPAEQVPAPVPAPRPAPASQPAPRPAAQAGSADTSLKKPAAPQAAAVRPSPVKAEPERKRLRKSTVIESEDEEEAAPGKMEVDLTGAPAEEGSEDEEEDESESASEEEDLVDRVLRKCERLAAKMREALSAFMQTEAAGGAAAASPATEGAAEGVAEGAAEGASGCLSAIEGRSGGRALAQPSNMSSQLVMKPYQLLGLNWLWALHQNELNGILADEMGLGKTVQLISLLAHLVQTAQSNGERAGPFLIITPTSTAENWLRELAVWCPSLVCTKYTGSEGERAALRDDLRSGARGGWDVLVTTYSLFERESSAAKDERAFLNKQHFDYMVLDEAQCIKNANSARFRNLCKLSVRRRLLLTGTPLENSLRELYTLLSFLMPSLIGQGEREQLISAGSGSASLDKARRVMAPFVLRRLKSQVLSQLLLPKQEVTLRLTMEGTHAAAYDLIMSTHVKRAEDMRAAATTAAAAEVKRTGNAELDDLAYLRTDLIEEGMRRGASGRGGAERALSVDKRWAKHAFMELRKAAQHPLLVRARYEQPSLLKIAEVLWRSEFYGDGASRERVAEEVSKLSDFKLHQLCAEHKMLHDLRLPVEAVRASAKFAHLAELLPRLKAEGHRVVIFSQWTSTLDILEEMLGSEAPVGLGLSYVRFDGSTNADDRQLLIDEYSGSDNIFAFLLTTRAGGVGINLTAADTVIIHDVDFNPSIDRQAQDRVHRIGQTKPVTIYRLVTAGTVDEKILALQSRKAEMNDRILHGEDGLAGSADDEASLCGSILSDLLRERMSAVTRSTAAAAAAAASAGGAGAPAAEGVKGGCELQTLAHVLASSSDGRANAPVESTSGGPADSPSDAELLEALDALVPPADSAEFAALTLKPIRRALVEQLGPAAKLSNEKLGKLINTLVEQRRVQGASAHFETPKAVAQ